MVIKIGVLLLNLNYRNWNKLSYLYELYIDSAVLTHPTDVSLTVKETHINLGRTLVCN